MLIKTCLIIAVDGLTFTRQKCIIWKIQSIKWQNLNPVNVVWILLLSNISIDCYWYVCLIRTHLCLETMRIWRDPRMQTYCRYFAPLQNPILLIIYSLEWSSGHSAVWHLRCHIVCGLRILVWITVRRLRLCGIVVAGLSQFFVIFSGFSLR